MDNKREQYMILKMSKSGKGCNMVTPSGNKNVYCNLKDLVEFLEGLRESVRFTIGERDESYQTGFEDLEDAER